MSSTPEHWNRIYRETEETRLGWYEEDPSPVFELLRQVDGWEESSVFLPGAGTSVLAERLLKAGSRLILNDLSPVALERLKARLTAHDQRIVWNCQDIARPLGNDIPEVDLWIDRAVLHFLTGQDHIRGYFRNLDLKLKPGGYALFAEFAPHGAPQCAGLELHRYSVEELSERLGSCYMMIDSFEHTYINPAGAPRPYLYALFRRQN
ncbi:MAG TPA: class I SAM-dependent methyltransferase [Pontiella sp.]